MRKSSSSGVLYNAHQVNTVCLPVFYARAVTLIQWRLTTISMGARITGTSVLNVTERRKNPCQRDGFVQVTRRKRSVSSVTLSLSLTYSHRFTTLIKIRKTMTGLTCELYALTVALSYRKKMPRGLNQNLN
jgi:hypothetical protein